MSAAGNHETLPENLRQALAVLGARIDAVVGIQGQTVDLMSKTPAPTLDLLNLIAISKEDHLSLLRFIGSSPVFRDHFDQEKFLTMVARAETQMDMIRASIADTKLSSAPPAGPGDVPPVPPV